MADKHTSFRFQPAVVEHLRKLAAIHDRTMTGYLERLILNQPLVDAGWKMPGETPAPLPMTRAPAADRMAEARRILDSVARPEPEYDPDAGRTVEPDPDYLASGPQPRQRRR